MTTHAAILPPEIVAPAPSTVAEAPLAPDLMRVSGRAAPVDIAVTVDLAIIDPAGERDTQTIFQSGPMLLVIDGYPSRPQNTANCASGFERWIRVIDMHDLKEQYAVQVESCVHCIRPGHPVLGLDSDVITINIEGRPPLLLHVADDLTVTTK